MDAVCLKLISLKEYDGVDYKFNNKNMVDVYLKYP